MNKSWAFALCFLICPASYALVGKPIDAADWVEEDAGAAPVFSSKTLLAVDMPPYVTLKVGVDPNTIRLGSDGVMRYVVVMVNSTGSVNAAYEGVRCTSAEVKTYARWTSQGTWEPVATPSWKDWNSNLPSKHAMAIARQGACEGGIANRPSEMVKMLSGKTPRVKNGGN